ncbi:hypothetical protein FGU65_05515 [Methanoculleus sp. FWC-SCC1]|uniref:Uncharacterized protein n=1 Tax=Methanoculleus frigidifontis TaxID=2584085 RepID=A0ABT8M8U2_9EURY|nr:hypothetical protein [Methanoculleus sp. FWC-SCC1]MDN7024353.1 hypothetical protein [Methanoculleus sp. FWC-SCC1]
MDERIHHLFDGVADEIAEAAELEWQARWLNARAKQLHDTAEGIKRHYAERVHRDGLAACTRRAEMMDAVEGL